MEFNEYACKRGEDPYIEHWGGAGWRTIYQHDIGEITYSNSFRALAYKGHIVFDEDKVDYFRTKMLHTLEVAGIADEIAKFFQFNRDLVKAIVFGHDIGHPPYGAIGEEVLRKITKNKFPRHSELSYRLAKRNSIFLRPSGGKLSEKYKILREKACYYRGKNYVCTITKETLDGIKKHCPPGDNPYEDLPQTAEGQIVRMADNIAYIIQEVEDAKAIDIFIEKEVGDDFDSKLRRGFPRDTLSHTVRGNIQGVVSNNISERINTIIERIVLYNGFLLDNEKCSLYKSKLLDKKLPILKYDPRLKAAIEFVWKKFIEEKLWEAPEVKKGREEAGTNITKFYDYLMKRLSDGERDKLYREAIEQKVMVDIDKCSADVKACLYIASLTNRGLEHRLRDLGLLK